MYFRNMISKRAPLNVGVLSHQRPEAMLPVRGGDAERCLAHQAATRRERAPASASLLRRHYNRFSAVFLPGAGIPKAFFLFTKRFRTVLSGSLNTPHNPTRLLLTFSISIHLFFPLIVLHFSLVLINFSSSLTS